MRRWSLAGNRWSRRLVSLAASVSLVLAQLGGSAAPVAADMTPTYVEATLRPGESIHEVKTVTVPRIIPKADIVFSFDLTGSMGGVLNTAKAEAINIMNDLDSLIADARYGVVSHMDYPGSYSSYGYSAMYGSAGCDYAYNRDQSLTTDRTAVVAAINGLSLACGADGPESYTRVLYESYADAGIGWRPDARRILIMFGDNVPHDNNLNEGITGGTFSTGGDPGRDEVMFTGDDLDLQTVLADMKTNGVILFAVWTNEFYRNPYWADWAGRTDGEAVLLSSAGDLPTTIRDLIEGSASKVNELKLEVSAGFASWVTISPASYTNLTTPATVTFDVTITVPDGTPPGDYSFTITAIGDGSSYGVQDVLIHVLPSNEPPVANPGGPYHGQEGSPVAFDGTGSTDPDGDPLTYAWDFGDGNTGSGPSPSHTYAEDGVYTVTLTVTDPEGLSDTATTTATIANVAPSVRAGGDRIPEGGVATVTASFTDPGVLDTHTATVDWGDGSPPETVPVVSAAGSGSLSASHAYGDDGDYTVTVTVTDDEGDSGSATATVAVHNLAPSVTLDTTETTAFAGGDAFTGRMGVEQSHRASASDPGSDDLTFAWSFGGGGTYYNDGAGPDPYPSPGGTYPFSAGDSGAVTFTTPGVHTVAVTVTDDDGGSDMASMPKVVTGAMMCTRSQGFWGHQYSGRGHRHIDDATLQAYVDIVHFASSVFSVQVPVTTLDEARAVLEGRGAMRTNAQAQLLAAWLNYASGAVLWDELIDTNGDGTADMPLHQVLAAAEAILLNPGASHAELEQAKDLAEAVNLHDQGCDDGDDGDAGGPPAGPPAGGRGGRR